ncbi:MAG: ABC transporter substrate-binding protein [Nocardioidaceae bacterium]|nr:ABC transporter substrate-binding protein [Nocardioidaceae bacterium]
MKRTPLLTLTGLLVAVLALAGCGSTRAPGGGGGSGAGDTFTYAFHLNVVTEWDPAVSYSNESIAMANIYESLTRYDATTKKVLPVLATKWDKSADGKTWTFTLRDGVTFHSGRKLDSTAVKEAIERTKKLAAGAAYIWDPVASIATPSPTSVVFTLKYPVALDLVASSGYGAYIYDTTAAGSGDLAAWFKTPHDAGTGPYTVASWQAGAETELKLSAYDDYWGGWEKDQYKNVAFRVTPEITTAWQLLQRGDVSFVDRLTPQLFAQAAKTDGLATSESTSFQNLVALYNTASGPLADVRVRRAVQLLTDTDAVVSALHGAVAPADSLIPAGLLGEGPVGVKPDAAEAKKLLAEAGYGSGHPLRLRLTYAQGDKDQSIYVTLLGSALKQAGVKLDARPMQWDAQWSQAKSPNAKQRQDVFVMYWYPDYADPYSWFVNLFKSAKEPYFNLSYLDDPAVDATIDKLPMLTATSPDQAAADYRSVQQRIIVEDAAVTPLYVLNDQRAYRSDFTGYADNPAYPNVVFVHDLHVK